MVKRRVALVQWSAVILFVGVLSYIITTYQLVQVTGNSMQPALRHQEYKVIHRRKIPQRYDLAVFDFEDQLIVKRIIGVPGDTFTLDGTKLIFDVSHMSETVTYTVFVSNAMAEQLPASGIIPLGKYFVVGDELQISHDSRTLGFFSRASVRGIILRVS